MNLEQIKNAKTKYLGKNIIYFPKMPSTQEYAKKTVDTNIPNGTLIITDYQTNGKGTKDRKWLTTNEENITMTFIVHPNKEISKLEGITIKIANAIQKAIFELYGYVLDIKEPNDLLLNGKKIVGILTQAITISQKVTHIYVGIGLNVNQEKFPTELENIATSLKKEYNISFEREEIIVKILEKIEEIF